MTEFWRPPLAETVRTSQRLARRRLRWGMSGNWLECYAEAAPTSSNQGVANIPFQRWFHFKEAFSPKFVADTLGALPYKVDLCLDPFGGERDHRRHLPHSRHLVRRHRGQSVPGRLDRSEGYAGAGGSSSARPIIAYYRASDLARRQPYNCGHAADDGRTRRKGRLSSPPISMRRSARSCVHRRLPPDEARLLRVLWVPALAPNSNVTINGKGRRYRRGWES